MFLAVAVDGETRALLRAHLEANGLDTWPGRIVPPDNWHLTLRFLGWTTGVQRDQVVRSLDEAQLPSAFRIRFGPLGAFPKPRRATVTWLGLRSGGDDIERLAAACEAAALAAGFESEDRPFHAHLTLSRVRPPVDLTERLAQFPPFDAAMRVGAVTLYESHLSRGGARYEVVDAVALRGTENGR